MLRVTLPAATAAGTAEHPVATVGRWWVRYGLVVVIAWIGALKYTSYEAAGIQPLVAHSPLFSWLYSIVSVRAHGIASADWSRSSTSGTPRCASGVPRAARPAGLYP